MAQVVVSQSGLLEVMVVGQRLPAAARARKLRYWATSQEDGYGITTVREGQWVAAHEGRGWRLLVARVVPTALVGVGLGPHHQHLHVLLIAVGLHGWTRWWLGRGALPRQIYEQHIKGYQTYPVSNLPTGHRKTIIQNL